MKPLSVLPVAERIKNAVSLGLVMALVGGCAGGMLALMFDGANTALYWGATLGWFFGLTAGLTVNEALSRMKWSDLGRSESATLRRARRLLLVDRSESTHDLAVGSLFLIATIYAATRMPIHSAAAWVGFALVISRAETNISRAFGLLGAYASTLIYPCVFLLAAQKCIADARAILVVAATWWLISIVWTTFDIRRTLAGAKKFLANETRTRATGNT